MKYAFDMDVFILVVVALYLGNFSGFNTPRCWNLGSKIESPGKRVRLLIPHSPTVVVEIVVDFSTRLRFAFR